MKKNQLYLRRAEHNNHPPGFTLIELLLVIVLMGVLTVMTTVQFGPRTNHLRLSSAAGELADLMKYAQSRAVLSGERLAIRADEEGFIFRLVKCEEDLPGPKRAAKGEEVLEFRRIPDNFSVELSQPDMVFEPDGQIDRVSIRMCLQKECALISTRHQRGAVNVEFEDEKESKG